MKIIRKLKVPTQVRDGILPYLTERDRNNPINSKEIATKYVSDLQNTRVLSQNGIKTIKDVEACVDAVIIDYLKIKSSVMYNTELFILYYILYIVFFNYED